jgi:uncharacterized protein YqjF (DUF2071 family)
VAFSLKNHPFAVEAFFETSLVLTYALPKADLQHLIPPCLTLDTLHNEWAFVAVALVQTHHLRPKGFPGFMGNDFFLIGFRIFVKYVNPQGKRLRGLYILHSETDKRKMSLLGNLFSHYKYTTTDIQVLKANGLIAISSHQSHIDIEVNTNKTDIDLPTGSPFISWKEARHFAGPLPFTFTYKQITREVLIIEGVRENWTPKPVEVMKRKVGFIEHTDFKEAILANAFMIENISYHWKKGKTELWKG